MKYLYYIILMYMHPIYSDDIAKSALKFPQPSSRSDPQMEPGPVFSSHEAVTR